MSTKAGKQNKTLPSRRGPQLGPAVEKQGPFFRLKITGALCHGGGRRRVGDPLRYPCPTAVPSPTRNNLLLPENPQPVQRSQGVGIPPSACEQGRLPRFAPRGQVRMRVGTALFGNRGSRGALNQCCATLGRSPNLSGPRPSSRKKEPQQMPSKVQRR